MPDEARGVMDTLSIIENIAELSPNFLEKVVSHSSRQLDFTFTDVFSS